MENKGTVTKKSVTTRNVDELLKELNSKQSTVKKYKEKLGYKYDANDPHGLGNRITIDDVNKLIKGNLLD